MIKSELKLNKNSFLSNNNNINNRNNNYRLFDTWLLNANTNVGSISVFLVQFSEKHW